MAEEIRRAGEAFGFNDHEISEILNAFKIDIHQLDALLDVLKNFESLSKDVSMEVFETMLLARGVSRTICEDLGIYIGTLKRSNDLIKREFIKRTIIIVEAYKDDLSQSFKTCHIP